MQPARPRDDAHAGPVDGEPVVKECRKPMSPVASAVRTSVSGTSLPRSTRSSNGLCRLERRRRRASGCQPWRLHRGTCG